MTSLNVLIGNSLSSCTGNNFHTFYNTDKFIYIAFNKLPPTDLTGRFINKATNNSIEIPIEISKLKKGSTISNTPYCTFPTISLYEPSSFNEWTLNIQENSSKKILTQFNILILVNKNYFTGIPTFTSETYCGVLFENKA